MSWIKLEKDLLTDPRVIRLAQFLSQSLEMTCTAESDKAWRQCNGMPLPGVTLVIGVLSQLWMIADTHIREDDILPLGVDEIDQLLGLPGFCELMPADWLQVIDEDRVKLPGYHTHNGTKAKELALNRKRVAKSRAKQLLAVTQSNGKALPDQDLDQDKTILDNPPTPLDIPASIGRESWDEWVKHRRKRRMPCDPVTLGKQVKLLATYSLTIQREIIDSSINSGWQGLFAPKGKAAALDPDPFANWQPPPDTDHDPH